MIIIGDEILSGRTQDTNLNYLARFLGTLGIDLKEARVVPDVEPKIVEAVNTLRAIYDHVFTTGGIGPTHDDITADAIARAFNVSIDYDPEAAKRAHTFNDLRFPTMDRVPRQSRWAQERIGRCAICSTSITC